LLFQKREHRVQALLRQPVRALRARRRLALERLHAGGHNLQPSGTVAVACGRLRRQQLARAGRDVVQPLGRRGTRGTRGTRGARHEPVAQLGGVLRVYAVLRAHGGDDRVVAHGQNRRDAVGRVPGTRPAVVAVVLFFTFFLRRRRFDVDPALVAGHLRRLVERDDEEPTRVVEVRHDAHAPLELQRRSLRLARGEHGIRHVPLLTRPG
jgi:hypothetical protein